MNRRHFAKLLGLGVFSILPGAGRVWKVQKSVTPNVFFVQSLQDYLKYNRLAQELGLHSLRFKIDSYCEYITKPVIWQPNMANTQRLVMPEQILKRPT